MADINKIEELRKEYDDLAVVCYINSTAEVKANCDVCCTSSNAIEVVKNLKSDKVLFSYSAVLLSFQYKNYFPYDIFYTGTKVRQKKHILRYTIKPKDVIQIKTTVFGDILFIINFSMDFL